MEQIVILFSPERASTASRLAEALTAQGYAATLDPVAEAEAASVPERARRAAAALLIWSRPLVSSAALDGWLATIRHAPNVVELSGDGIAPQSGDQSRIVLLSGWRGQPFHPGWQRVLAEVTRLCGAPGAAPRPARPAEEATGPRTAGTAAPARSGGGAGRGTKLALVGAAALAAVGGVSAVLWTQAPSTAPAPPAAQREAPHRAPAAPAPAAAAPTPAMPAAPPAPAVDNQAAASPAPPPPASDDAAEKASAKAKRPHPAKASDKRYSGKYSKTMRLFCARSGRSTPQCRDFRRATGGEAP